jgi:hypothetical protein
MKEPAMKRWRDRLRSVPAIGPAALFVYKAIRRVRSSGRSFPGTADYWESRYARDGTSGAGSYDRLAAFKAEVINEWVRQYDLATVIEFGCGDGNQLALARYGQYLGFDVATSAIDKCRSAFRADPTKAFRLMEEYSGERADLSLSLDVIYHLVEDAVFDQYMRRLFDAARKFVVIYSSNEEGTGDATRSAPHVRHRRFSDWVEMNAPGWKLRSRVPNRFPYDPANSAHTSYADFYIYERAA